ncbi:MAG: hypothetical protein ISQ73_17005 [Verrucomicrobiae bacterium]|nr:hypothetical protein [Verrucomicrobiae bacterium]
MIKLSNLAQPGVQGRNILIFLLAWKCLSVSVFITLSAEVLKTDSMQVQIKAGHLHSLTSLPDEINYLPEGVEAPVLSLRVDGSFHSPSRMDWHTSDSEMHLFFDDTNIKAVVAYTAHSSHVSFELRSVEPTGKTDLAVWGPYPTTIKAIVGETVGVVRDQQYAIGIQSLNAKTLGGFPVKEDDVMPMYNIFDGSDYSDIALKFKDQQLYRGNTAEHKEYGSVIQAYCRDRSEQRTITNWGHPQYIAPPFEDGGLVGSRIALFGCPANQALKTIGIIEEQENLPHPEIDDVWAKISPDATASYLIVSFGEDEIDEAIKLTKSAGLRYLYHGGPFQTWGHFKLNPNQFPDNWRSMQRCVTKAKASGVRLGVHTLSNFIKPNDPYVAPSPDPRLAAIGASTLNASIDATQDQIPIEKPDFFQKKTTMNTVRIGEELIRYQAVSAEAPWFLTGCQRGAWGTKAKDHDRSEKVAKLMDHGYRVFLSNTELSLEIARNIADLFNQTKLAQISFDGLEGNWSTGMGQYGRTLFTKAWFDHLKPALQGSVINDASNPGHFNWHIYTRMNWGEPWYAGFRESQTLYRLKNQAYYSRNLMPRMLGWFQMNAKTSVEDAEWLLARAAGFDAGFALATNPKTVQQNGLGIQVIEKIHQWETARMRGAFPEALKPELQQIEKEFELEASEDGSWQLYPVFSFKQSHQHNEQPGMIAFSSYDFVNPHPEQALQFIIQSTGKSQAIDVTLEINSSITLDLRSSLKPGEILKYDGGPEIITYDASWHMLDKRAVNSQIMKIAQGPQSINLGYRFEGNEPALKLEIRTIGKPTHLVPSR